MKKLLKSPMVLFAIALIGGLSIASTSDIVNGSYGYFHGMWTVLLGAYFFTLLGSYGNAIYDATLIKNGVHIDHPKRLLVRTFAALAFSFISFRVLSFDMIMMAVNMGFLFWFAFDIMLNLQRGKDAFYLSTWYNTSWLDKIFRGEEELWLATKLILFLTSLLILI